MAGTVTFAYDDGVDGGGLRRGITKVVVSWTCTAGGAADGTSRKLVGTLVKAVTDPTDSPTDNYDITLTDDAGADILSNCDADLTNRDVTNSEERYFLIKDAASTAQSLHPIVCSTVTVTIANAGSTKSGVLYLYVRN